ncbi:glycine betaine/proline ABC transporter, periplasmic substrate-binding protein (plasmid) [Ruegeria pomeroyi DSS-3]|uniref:Glycine betaine/proline ABC transporter, periplasmic substrate-binding protein n=3 Tax=Ruegeria pomeroyi TaxID=89184 RepID=Q5LKZ8_RUEPO|nr:glycine betaine ABC transporter substrate-binding protein [Ruegeria pomeroyi]AAV97365.1 glycine betaine/proline ABC transporter, periplasmic substrate-binding protein [Ruegeria pomeroyi DSS-3]NVK96837.1 amino acid-binding protein [Ruegeria pomeroyi]NVL02505.1 amino acid-binding protein [Ruegeria pomeroyi]HCE71642.1 amino acid-binding protein [Ruegeria sp.]
MENLTRWMTTTVMLSLGTSAFAADVVIGVPNWPSVRATAHVLKIVLEDNLGLEVELQNGSNPIIFEAMDAGAMQVHPEVWLPNQSNLHNTFVKEKGTVAMNPNGIAADQAMCVTRGTAERTGIKALSELSDPDMAAKFDSDGDGLGEIWIGAAGWASTNVEKIRAKSYGYDQTMTLKEMDETLALAEVDAATDQDTNIAFFCYTPHHMFQLYDLVLLEEPPHDPAQWKVAQPTDDPNWLENSSAAVAWDKAYLHIHYQAEMDPAAAAVLAKVDLTSDQVSAMVYALIVDGMDAEAFARNWVEENADQVDSWLN